MNCTLRAKKVSRRTIDLLFIFNWLPFAVRNRFLSKADFHEMLEPDFFYVYKTL